MLVLALVLVVAAAVQEPARATFTPPVRTSVLYDTDGQGAIFALGADYKMRFGPDGARYAPILGPDAPRSLPLAFHLEGAEAALPVRDGERVVFDRGAVVEVYDLAFERVEQSFVLRERPAASELRIGVETELAFAGRTAAGLRFDAPSRASVTYSDAVAIDARGARASLPVRFENGAIVIPLPQAFLDARAGRSSSIR